MHTDFDEVPKQATKKGKAKVKKSKTLKQEESGMLSTHNLTHTNTPTLKHPYTNTIQRWAWLWSRFDWSRRMMGMH